MEYLKSKEGTPMYVSGKAGRNELCACGRGKKTKKCCGDRREYFQRTSPEKVKAAPDELKELMRRASDILHNPPEGKTKIDMYNMFRDYLQACKVESVRDLPKELWEGFKEFLSVLEGFQSGRESGIITSVDTDHGPDIKFPCDDEFAIKIDEAIHGLASCRANVSEGIRAAVSRWLDENHYGAIREIPAERFEEFAQFLDRKVAEEDLGSKMIANESGEA